LSDGLRIDLHVHTFYSGDAITSPREAVLWAKKAGLHGLAITDHDTLKGALKAHEIGRREGVLILPGMELESRGGHVLALCPLEPVRPGNSLAETVETVREAGGLAILAHPYHLLAPRAWDLEGLRALDAVEVLNASDPLAALSTRLAIRLARALGKPETGGSDAHFPEAIGAAYTVVEADPDPDEVLSAIEKGLTTPSRRALNPMVILKKWAIPNYLR